MNLLSKYINQAKKAKIKIIHTDDHSLFRYGIRTALKDFDDIEFIGETSNGQELLDLLTTTIPDIVILNVNMPVLNGFETLPKIKTRYPHLKVIVLSMHTDPAVITKMMRLGANTYLSKNIEGAQIYQAIRCVHEYNYYYSEPIATSYIGSEFYTEQQDYIYSAKELQLLKLEKENKAIKEIASIMDISERTVLAISNKLKRKSKHSP